MMYMLPKKSWVLIGLVIALWGGVLILLACRPRSLFGKPEDITSIGKQKTSPTAKQGVSATTQLPPSPSIEELEDTEAYNSKDSYIFIHLSQEVKGAPVMIDRPVVYHFDSESGILQGAYFEVNEELMAVIGHTLEVSEPGSGNSGGLTPIYTIPSSLDTPFSWRIVGLEEDGTCSFEYEGQNIKIAPETSFERTFRTEWMGHTVQYQVNIINYGIMDKSKIK